MKKKETWKFILQTLLSVLSAIATAFGVASCIVTRPVPPPPPRTGTGRTGVFFAPFAILFLRETRIFAAP